MAYIAVNGKDGAFSYFHGHTNCEHPGDVQGKRPSTPFLLDGEFPLGYSASLAIIAIPREKKTTSTILKIHSLKKLEFFK